MELVFELAELDEERADRRIGVCPGVIAEDVLVEAVIGMQQVDDGHLQRLAVLLELALPHLVGDVAQDTAWLRRTIWAAAPGVDPADELAGYDTSKGTIRFAAGSLRRCGMPH
jgi:hypothetical protein